MSIFLLSAVRGITLALAALSALPAIAADYPVKPVRIIVPFAPGSTDIAARAIADRLGQRLGQPVIVENKPGASTMIGTEFVANAAPDGYTLLYTSGVLTALKALNKNLKFDPEKSFAPVSLISQGYFALAVNASLPVRSFQEFVSYAKANPGKLNYVSLGRNSIMLMVESLKAQAEFGAVPIPFPGMAPGRLALVRNDVQFMLDGPQSLKQFADAGQLRLLMYAGPKRTATLPDVPASAEAGLPGYVAGYFVGVLAPAGTPKDIVSRLSTEIAAVIKMPEIAKLLTEDGGEVVGSTPEAFAQRIENDQKRYAEAARHGNIQPE